MTEIDRSKYNTPYDNFMLNFFIPLFFIAWLIFGIFVCVLAIFWMASLTFGPPNDDWFRPSNFALQDLGGVGFLLLLAAIGFVVARIVRRFS